MEKLQPLHRAGRPRDIGAAVVFLSGDATAGFATGTDLLLDGGVLLSPGFAANQFHQGDEHKKE